MNILLQIYCITVVSSGKQHRKRNAAQDDLTVCVFIMQSMIDDIRVSFMGDIKSFPKEIINLVNETIDTTSKNKSLNLNIALGYSSRQEIVNTTKQIANEVLDKTLEVKNINSDLISERLENSYLGNPDLLIRTGGESRISDFLLWQIAYSEIYFTGVYWPDFDESEYSKAILDYQNRERRFGKISEQIS